MKQCSHCGERKAPSEFYGRSDTADGLQRHCKRCQHAATKRHRKRMREMEAEIDAMRRRAWARP